MSGIVSGELMFAALLVMLMLRVPIGVAATTR
jgi:hypothetical protein